MRVIEEDQSITDNSNANNIYIGSSEGNIEKKNDFIVKNTRTLGTPKLRKSSKSYTEDEVIKRDPNTEDQIIDYKVEPHRIFKSEENLFHEKNIEEKLLSNKKSFISSSETHSRGNWKINTFKLKSNNQFTRTVVKCAPRQSKSSNMNFNLIRKNSNLSLSLKNDIIKYFSYEKFIGIIKNSSNIKVSQKLMSTLLTPQFRNTKINREKEDYNKQIESHKESDGLRSKPTSRNIKILIVVGVIVIVFIILAWVFLEFI